AGFERGDQLDQLLLDWLQTPRERTFELLRRDFCLVESLCVDQIAHRFGLREIDAAVKKGAHRELSRLGQARSGGDAELDYVTKHDRRTVRRDFDDVVGSVGVRLGEVGDHDFVDARLVWSVRPTRVDQFPENRSPWLQFML